MELIIDLSLSAKEVSRYGNEVVTCKAGVIVPAGKREIRTLAIRLLGDERAEAVIIDRKTTGDRSARLGQFEFDTDPPLFAERPVTDFVALIATFLAWSPRASLMAFVSQMSPKPVDVA